MYLLWQFKIFGHRKQPTATRLQGAKLANVVRKMGQEGEDFDTFNKVLLRMNNSQVMAASVY